MIKTQRKIRSEIQQEKKVSLERKNKEREEEKREKIDIKILQKEASV